MFTGFDFRGVRTVRRGLLRIGLLAALCALPALSSASRADKSAEKKTVEKVAVKVLEKPGPEPPGEISIHFDPKARVGKKDMLATLHDEGHFETLLKAVKVAGLEPYLKGKGPLTMFVPTDDAFAKLPAGTLERWLKDPKTLKNALRYHIIKAYVPSKQMFRLRNALMANGATARFDVTPGEGGNSTIVINWEIAKVTRWDIMAVNGVMHVTDNVIVPPRPAPDSTKGKDGKKKGGDEAEPAEGT